jgi:hypothetical protein
VVHALMSCAEAARLYGAVFKRRARDVLDILLIDLLGKVDATAVRAAAKHIFTQRATHEFPPAIKIPDEWKPELEAFAKELGCPATSAAETEARFRTCVDKNASAI